MEENKTKITVEKHKWPDEIAAEKKRRRKVVVIVLLCFVFFFGGFLVRGSGSGSIIPSNNGNASNAMNSKKFNQIYELMLNHWYFGKDIEDLNTFLEDSAIRGLANDHDMDPHTSYLDVEQAQSLLTSLAGSLTGIGIQYYDLNGSIIVEKVFINSPAEKGGIKQGDIIVKVDGKDIKDVEISKIREMILGEAGTKVTVDVKRGNEIIPIEMTRAKVSVTSFGYVKDGVGILELSSFSDNTASEVEQYLAMFKKENVNDIVIDLRNNGGGFVTTAIDIASLFLDEDEVVLYQENMDGTLTDYRTAAVDTVYKYNNIVILINENTASASELLTGALSEHLGAITVGTKSFGKGTVQRSTEFSDGSLFKYTIAEWLTPNKQKINKKGFEPKYEVKLDVALSHTPSKSKTEYTLDQVGNPVKDMQIYLSFLGYTVDRKDGYYSQATWEAVKKFQADNGFEVNGKVNQDLIKAAISASSRMWHDKKAELDVQMLKALEVVRAN